MLKVHIGKRNSQKTWCGLNKNKFNLAIFPASIKKNFKGCCLNCVRNFLIN